MKTATIEYKVPCSGEVKLRSGFYAIAQYDSEVKANAKAIKAEEQCDADGWAKYDDVYVQQINGTFYVRGQKM